jgi:hypothetical protein
MGFPRLRARPRMAKALFAGATAVVLVGLSLGTAGAHHPITSREIRNGTVRRADINNATENYFVVPGRVPAGKTIRGAIGGDFHVYSEASDDFGIAGSLPIPASSPLGDDDVHINVDTWTSGDAGQTQPTTDDDDPRCDGTLRRPTAPRGDVCIYIAGGDNAANVEGFSVRPGTARSRYGFKLKWDAPATGDTFLEGVWAYRAGS